MNQNPTASVLSLISMFLICKETVPATLPIPVYVCVCVRAPAIGSLVTFKQIRFDLFEVESTDVSIFEFTSCFATPPSYSGSLNIVLSSVQKHFRS